MAPHLRSPAPDLADPIAIPSPQSNFLRIALLFRQIRVIDVLDRDTAEQRRLSMKTFTIDAENNIIVHASKKAAHETGLPTFANEVQLADLIGADNKRLVEIWNSLPGVKPVSKFANRKVATERIWKTVQSLGESPQPANANPEPETETAPVEAKSEPASGQAIAPVESTTEAHAEPESTLAEPLADAGAQATDVGPGQPVATNGTMPAKKARKTKKAPKTVTETDPKPEAAGPREGSKMSQVIAMLQREQGATITEIMNSMGWQKHTVRGFMAGAMKKAGYTVESFKPEGGERSYRINK
jgi:Protein of unknown function (DUF3489)